MKTNTILQGDCLELMKEIPDASIDMILCDLPYGSTKNQWDVVIPFEPLWKQYERVIKNNGAIVLMGQNMFTVKLITSNPKLYRYTIIWEKTRAGGFLNARRMPLQAHEDILIFYKKLPTYNPQFLTGEPYIKTYVKNGDGGNYGKFERLGTLCESNGTRFPRSVIKFSNDSSKVVHPTQKPVALFEYLIKTYTNEGDLVLDSCVGSGTTAVACVNTNRNYIGIEKESKYAEIAGMRIGEAQMNPPLFKT